MFERDESPGHTWDESQPTEFVRHVGMVGNCACGADRVAGYLCRNDPGVQQPIHIPKGTNA